VTVKLTVTVVTETETQPPDSILIRLDARAVPPTGLPASRTGVTGRTHGNPGRRGWHLPVRDAAAGVPIHGETVRRHSVRGLVRARGTRAHWMRAVANGFCHIRPERPASLDSLRELLICGTGITRRADGNTTRRGQPLPGPGAGRTFAVADWFRRARPGAPTRFQIAGIHRVYRLYRRYETGRLGHRQRVWRRGIPIRNSGKRMTHIGARGATCNDQSAGGDYDEGFDHVHRTWSIQNTFFIEFSFE
jgi:hypothetical protein